ncbi:MAG: TrkA family potassium uptake protein [Actinomycetaceae bacterium]|nr:TrkA family potassium uptake protein [Actinomycetaceae bacterium]
MGCGRVGASLALNLTSMGHSVAIIDQKNEAFQKLPDDFAGQTVTGIGFDRDVLERAGIAKAQGFVAVSSGDNSNIISARVAHEEYGIKNVIARIYDIERARVYEKLGIRTIQTVSWSTEHILQRLIPLGPHYAYTDNETKVSLFQVNLHEDWYGHTVDSIESVTSSRIAYIVRHSRYLNPTGNTIVHDDDVLHMVAPTNRAPEIQALLIRPDTKETQ